MTDKFTQDLEKLKKIEKSLKSDIIKRTELENKNQSTSIVRCNFK
jgi:hypothetical protein